MFAPEISQPQHFRVLNHPFLETEEIIAAGIGLIGRRLAQQPAQIGEVLLIGGSLLAPIARPFPLEFSGGHFNGKCKIKNQKWIPRQSYELRIKNAKLKMNPLRRHLDFGLLSGFGQKG
jgi:hypothetical protein